MKSNESVSNDKATKLVSSQEAISLVEKHLSLWGERNSGHRKLELPKVYCEDVKVFDPSLELNGVEEMNDFIDGLLVKFKNFRFSVLKPIESHHNIARLSWGFGDELNPHEITGQDFFTFENGKIKTLGIFLDV